MAGIGSIISGAVASGSHGGPVAGASQSFLQQLTTGIPMPYSTLKLLTAFPPTGMLGMNHAALGNQALAFIKAGSVAICILIVTLMLPYYPMQLRKPIVYLSYFGPWFMFDIFEVFNEIPFKRHGFRLPLNFNIEGLTKELPNDGKWKLTTAMLTAIGASLASYGLVITNLIPPSILPASASKYMSIVAGGAGITLGCVALGLMLSSSNSTTAPTTTAHHAPAAHAAHATPAAHPAPAVHHGGGSVTLPPLSSFADKLIQAKSPDESLAFLSTIALIVIGGIATASLNIK